MSKLEMHLIKKVSIVSFLLLLTHSVFAGGSGLRYRPDFPFESEFGADSYGGSGRNTGKSYVCLLNSLDGDSTTGDDTDDSDNIVSGPIRYCTETFNPAGNDGIMVVPVVSGTIDLGNEHIELHSWMTLAFQTAPYPGLTIKSNGFRIGDSTHDVVLQHVRIRVGEQWGREYVTTWSNYSGDIYSASLVYIGLDGGAAYHPGTAYYSSGGAYTELTEETSSCPGGVTANEWCEDSGTIYADVGGADPDSGTFVVSADKSYMPDGIKITEGSGSAAYNIILDHVSVAWGTDVPVTIEGDDVLVIDSIIADPMGFPLGPKQAHAKCILIKSDSVTEGGDQVAIIRNLMAHAHDRMPRVAGGEVTVANNLIYDWSATSGIILFDGSYASQGVTKVNIIGNYLIESLDDSGIVLQVGQDTNSRVYISPDNFMGGGVEADPWNNATNVEQCGNWSTCDEDVPAINQAASVITDSYPTGYTTMTAAAAKAFVLAHAGAYPAWPDDQDQTMKDDVKNEVNRGEPGVVYGSNDECIDTDIPFGCCESTPETSNCPVRSWQTLGTNNNEAARRASLPSDFDTVRASGRTALEEWLHTIALEVEDLSKPQFEPINFNSGKITSAPKPSGSGMGIVIQ